MYDSDIIAAVATAWGESAIAIVRLSGPGSVALVSRFFVSTRGALLPQLPPRHMTLGCIVSPADDSVVDEVLVVRFEQSASYTGEESVEIHCHGGIVPAQSCLDLILKSGEARVALPGEFTKRAFLNGRIDLAQAEAVNGMIKARSDSALAASVRSLRGELSEAVEVLRQELTTVRAQLEVSLDYPEEADDADISGLVEALSAAIAEAGKLISRARTGLVLKEGISAAILGKPNVGKSSLFNALLESDRAIVSPLPGTTRDTVNASFVHRGLAVELVDTAGIRQSADPVEELGVKRSKRALGDSEVILFVVDGSLPPDEDDFRIERLLEGRAILVANKSDLEGADIKHLFDSGRFRAAVDVSAATGDGVDSLKEAIFNIAIGDASVGEGYAASQRMIDSLVRAYALMDEAKGVLQSSGAIDAAGSLLAESAEMLASITGADASEELLDEIFSSFCVGK